MFLQVPLSYELPLPVDLARAIDFSARSSNKDLKIHWSRTISRLESIASSFSDLNVKWRDLARESLRPAIATVNVPLLKFALFNFGMQGNDWVGRFLFGFGLTGSHSQKNVFPSTTCPPPPPDLISV